MRPRLAVAGVALAAAAGGALAGAAGGGPVLGALLAAAPAALAGWLLVLRPARRLRAELERLARVDGLTGLLDHAAFLDEARAAWARASRRDAPLGVAVLDVDGFGRLNAAHGRAAADRALVALATTIRRHVRHGDRVARTGADELAVLLPEADAAEAARVARRLRELTAAVDPDLPDGTRLSASVGWAVRGPRDLNVEALFQRALEHLDHAREAGGDRVHPPGA